MAGVLGVFPRQLAVNSGAFVAGAKLFVYDDGTTTKRAIYTTSALSVQHSNPLVADANGRFAAFYVDPAGGPYKLVLASSSDTDPPASPIWTDDVVPVAVNDSQLSANVALLNASNTFTASQNLLQHAAQHDLTWNITGGASNEKRWSFAADATTFYAVTRTDVGAAGPAWLQVERTGTTVDSVTLSATSTTLTGTVTVGAGTLLTTATAGFVYVPTCAGTPTGTPAGGSSPFSPIVIDTTNHRLYFYSGGAWRNAGP